MRTITILFLVVASLFAATRCLATPVADNPITVRVASYNVEFSRSATPEQIGEMFKPYKLDIIGFDEVPDGDWTARVGKVLGMNYCYVGKISSANHKDKYKSILSRTPLEGTEEHQLSSTGLGWNPASVVRAVTQIDGVSFAFYSLHICKSGATDGHAHSLATKVLPQEKTKRVIVVGDYNNNIGDTAMNTVEGAGFRPTWKDLQINVSREFTYNAQDSTKNLGVIDHIIYNTSAGAKATEGGIIELEKPLSDHKPIWAEIVFPRNLKKVAGFQSQDASQPQTNANAPKYEDSVPQPTLSAVRYGDHERHILDFWKAPSDTPTPLVFVIHGGGWRNGSKERVNRFVDVAALLKEGISVVAINYRLMKHAEEVEPPVKAPLHDAARALQFVRINAEEWNIDKERIGAAGASAGACSSLWLLYHDDLAVSDSKDLVTRESTRLYCAAVINAQTTLDPGQMKEWTPNSVYGGHAFGINGFEEFLAKRENILPWIQEYSPYALVSPDDPPVYIFYKAPPSMGKAQKDPTHTANFGVKLQERCMELGLTCELMYPGASNVKFKTPTDYLIATLKLPDEAGSKGLENNYGIIPMPYSIEAMGGKPFQINAKTVIVCRDKEQKASAKYLQQRIAGSTGMKLAIKKSGSSNAIVLQVEPETVEFTEKDAYTFESSKDGITITGKSASGLFYGIQTLFQLLPAGIYSDTPVKDMTLSVDALLIKDKPSMSRIRGLHVDIARHFRTKEELKKIIDCMTMHKLNTLHIHLSDEQSWRVEIKAYPKLTTVGAIGSKSDPNSPAAFLTQKEVKELCAYAADRYVAIIPEIDMPGHMGAAIRAYPELNHPKDVNNKRFAIRGDDLARDFVKTILTEINELFDPEYIHIGFDEVNLGAKTELYTEAELVDFASEVTIFIKEELRKTPIVWDDVFVQGLHDKDVVVQWWRYGKNYWWRNLELPVDEELNQRQQPFILSPAYWTYFDMPNLAPEKGWAKPISTAEVYNWDPFGDMLGVNEYTRELAIGAIACTWSERIITMKDFGDRTFPRLAGYSERLWSGGRSENPSVLDWEDYRDQVLIPYQLDRYDALGVWYWSKDKPELLKNLKSSRKKLY